jgi:hypothetical protein
MPSTCSKMGLGLGPVVQAENACDNAVELGGQAELALPSPIGSAGGALVDAQARPESVLHGRDLAHQLDAAPAPVDLADGQTVGGRKTTYGLDILRRRPMGGRIFLPGQASGDGLGAPQICRYSELRAGRGLAHPPPQQRPRPET